jgi:hypothetical protein
MREDDGRVSSGRGWNQERSSEREVSALETDIFFVCLNANGFFLHA